MTDNVDTILLQFRKNDPNSLLLKQLPLNLCISHGGIFSESYQNLFDPIVKNGLGEWIIAGKPVYSYNEVKCRYVESQKIVETSYFLCVITEKTYEKLKHKVEKIASFEDSKMLKQLEDLYGFLNET